MNTQSRLASPFVKMAVKTAAIGGFSLFLLSQPVLAAFSGLEQAPLAPPPPPPAFAINDPLESINRPVYTFNKQVDKFVYKPTAQVYKAVLPTPFRTGVTNFFYNLDDVPTMVNDLLQGEPQYAYYDLWRLMINSTVGVVGLIDVAGYLGMEKRFNDFGVTLGKWGVSKAPYLMVPFFGPSTIRDGLGILVDYGYLSVWPYIESVSLRNTLFVLDFINFRASLLESEGVMKQASIDEYAFIRDAYLQKRYSKIYGNNTNSDPLADTDLGDDWDKPAATGQ